jgi:cell division protein FtsB
MVLYYEIRRRVRAAVVPAVCALVLGYFGYHLVEGDRGLAAWSNLVREVRAAELALDTVREERRRLEHRVSLLDQRHLDLDILEERTRAVLGLAHPDDVIVFDVR